MGFSYHPPTRDYCSVCEELANNTERPIIDYSNGKASSANNFPIHNWYNFVLGYTPEFPNYILDREKLPSDSLVVDPFSGTGTTLLCCKMRGIPSFGIDANDYFVDVTSAKLNWDIDIVGLKASINEILYLIAQRYDGMSLDNADSSQPTLFKNANRITPEEYASKHRPSMLDSRYISDKPFVKIHIIKRLIDAHVPEGSIKKLLNLALSSIILPASNVSYGPGFGIKRAREDADVHSLFKSKLSRIVLDLETLPKDKIKVPSTIVLGDSRELNKHVSNGTVDLMITSPPYPGDHEYSKYTRLELIIMGYAHNIDEFRRIKKRMLRASTTNIYKEDNEYEYIAGLVIIEEINSLIKSRLKEDGATSGFEKLYPRVVQEYFGGMYTVLNKARLILKDGGRFVLLVGDSHAFKMVHIQTAKILAEIGRNVGFKESHIELWQDKISTSHKYNIKENILTLIK